MLTRQWIRWVSGVLAVAGLVIGTVVVGFWLVGALLFLAVWLVYGAIFRRPGTIEPGRLTEAEGVDIVELQALTHEAGSIPPS